MFYKTTVLALFVAATLSNVWASAWVNTEFNKSDSIIDYQHSYLVASTGDRDNDGVSDISDAFPDDPAEQTAFYSEDEVSEDETSEIEIILTPPPAVTQEATARLSSVLFGTATAVDDDGESVPLKHNAPKLFPVGVTIITWMAWEEEEDDGVIKKEHVTTATQTVTVTDTTAPVVTPPANITVEATAALTAVTLGTASATDLVDGAVTATADVTGPFAVGVHTITWSATDAAGNTGTATQHVTITDTTAPTLTLTGAAAIVPGT